MEREAERARRRPSSWLRRVTETVAWMAVLMLGYVFLVSTMTRAETVTGLVFALAGALLGAVAIGPFRPEPPPRSIPWRRVWWLPLDVVRGTGSFVAAVTGAVLHRGHRGDEESVRLANRDDPPGARAYGVLVLSATPASYVLAVEEAPDDEDDTVRVHRLGAEGRVEGTVVR